MNIHFDFLSEILSASEVDENIENIYCSFKKINNEIYFVIKVSGKLPDLTYFEKETMYFIDELIEYGINNINTKNWSTRLL